MLGASDARDSSLAYPNLLGTKDYVVVVVVVAANSALLPLNVRPFSAAMHARFYVGFLPPGPNHAQAHAESIQADWEESRAVSFSRSSPSSRVLASSRPRECGKR
jgi:hypothetical protein